MSTNEFIAKVVIGLIVLQLKLLVDVSCKIIVRFLQPLTHLSPNILQACFFFHVFKKKTSRFKKNFQLYEKKFPYYK